jgi:glycerate 2-kinase
LRNGGADSSAAAILRSVPTSSRKLRADALSIFKAGLAAADAGEAVRRNLAFTKGSSSLRLGGGATIRLNDFDRIFVVGAGKAGAAMAAALEEAIGAERIEYGSVNVKSGHSSPRPRRIQLQECGHPLPDDAGRQAANQIEDLLRTVNGRDLVFVLISGGASALLTAPTPPISLGDKQKTTDLLLKAGADIYELNAVRKHISRLKGGQLAALAYPATVVSLVLSDVIGDPLDVIGSGPTAADRTTFGDALRVLSKYNLTKKAPRSVMARLEEGARARIPETPKPSDKLFANVHNVIVGSNSLALDAARNRARELGYTALILSSSIQGETREVARVHAEILREVVCSGRPVPPPACILSGGETTVTVRGKGKGGRNQEFALAAALALAGTERVMVLSGGTDGTDGPTDAAGAIADGTTQRRAEAKAISLQSHLDENDAYPAFQALDDLVKTGPTGTNVMDLHILLAGQ